MTYSSAQVQRDTEGLGIPLKSRKMSINNKFNVLAINATEMATTSSIIVLAFISTV